MDGIKLDAGACKEFSFWYNLNPELYDDGTLGLARNFRFGIIPPVEGRENKSWGLQGIFVLV